MARRRAPVRPLPGRVVAITGAARGIGLATAEILLRRGARVALGDLDGELAAERAAGRAGAVGLEVDVTDRDSFAAFLAATEAALGAVDVLVNNAGIMPIGPLVDEPDVLTRRQIDVNVHGVVLGMKLALPAMVARRSGHVVNIGSAASLTGLAHEAVYCATKHAVYGLTESARIELRGTGVDATIVMPNLASTELGAGMTAARGQELLTPESVAEAIVGVIERPRFEVAVPSGLDVQLKVLRLLPARGRDVVARAFHMDRVATAPRTTERAGYVERVTRDAR